MADGDTGRGEDAAVAICSPASSLEGTARGQVTKSVEGSDVCFSGSSSFVHELATCGTGPQISQRKDFADDDF